MAAITTFLSAFLAPLRHPSTAPSTLSLTSSFSKLSLQQNPSGGGSLTSQPIVCRSTYNVQVIVAENEHEERLVNRFRREVLRAGVIQESKRRHFFETSQEKRKRKSRDAARRNRKRRPMARTAVGNAVSSGGGVEEGKGEGKKKKGWYDESEDNWEVPGEAVNYIP